MSVLFHVTVRLPLHRLLLRLLHRPLPPYSWPLATQITVDGARALFELPPATVTGLLRANGALGCWVYKLANSPVESTRYHRQLASSVWFGPADLAASTTHVLIFCHGGAFGVGTSRMWPRFYQLLIDGAEAVGMPLRILSVEYPLAYRNDDGTYGTHGFQSAIATVHAAFDYLREEVGVPSSRIFLGGDSAGGNLALTSCIALRDRALPGDSVVAASLPRALVLICPWSDLSSRSDVFSDGPMSVENARWDLLSRSRLERMRDVYVENAKAYEDEQRRGDGATSDGDEFEDGSPAKSSTSVSSRRGGRSSSAAAAPASASSSLTASHPLISPIYADLSSLPPVHLVYGEREVFLADCDALHAALTSHGVKVDCRRTPAQPHDFVCSVESTGQASEAAITDIIKFMAETRTHGDETDGRATQSKAGT